ncbi:MAG: hypothetical protein M5U14_01220 [Acidimicrobiia bacterium]|nr:hypothetical protein [Acidimicrobiia bacterium]
MERARPSVVSRLQHVRGAPAVSLLAPVDRHRPGNAEDPLRLRGLVEEARRRLSEDYAPGVARALADRLAAAVDRVDLRDPPDGVAVYVTMDRSTSLRLPFPVRERVVVDETFVTRDLVLGFQRRPRYRVLVLGERRSRLFEGVVDRLEEWHEEGFPSVAPGAAGEPLPSGGYPQHTSQADEQYRQRFRRVDEALRAISRDDPLPLVVVGVERDLAFFDEVTGVGDLVAGRVAGNHEESTAHEVAAVAWVVMADHEARRRAAAVAELVDAVGRGRAVTGTDEVWTCAREGRGHRLLVEEDLVELPNREVDGRLEPAVDVDAPGVMDDVVDEIVEAVLAQGGEVTFVEPEALADQGRIGLLLRY